MGFPRQEYWNGLPFPSPGDLPDTRIEPVSPVWHADSLPLSNLGSLIWCSINACSISSEGANTTERRCESLLPPAGGQKPSLWKVNFLWDWFLFHTSVAFTPGFIDINSLVHTTTLRSVCPFSLIFQPWGRLSLREMSHWPDKCHNWDSNPGQSLDLSLNPQV